MSDGRVLQASSLLVAAVLFGGGGSGAGLANLVVQLAAIAVLAFNRAAFLEFFERAPRPAVFLVAASILLPALQIIPLPPSLWQHLPGRNLATEALALVGGQDDWRPFSLNVRRTIIAWFSLMPPFAILILSWNLSEQAKRQLLLVLVAAGVFVVLLGAQQLALGNRFLVPYPEVIGSGDLVGTFANHNSAALFIDAALCALMALATGRGQRPVWRAATVAAGVLLLVGLFLTRSRSGMVLVIVPVVQLALSLWQARAGRSVSWRKVVLGSAVVLLGLSVVAGLAVQNRRIQLSLSRFDDLQDARPMIWRDTVGSIKHFWPVGSGIGTFDEVFQIDESLEYIGPGRAARAHNDFLEAALESGVIGLGLMSAWLVFLGLGCIRAVGAGGVALLSSSLFTLFLLQSILDYPLRNQTLLSIAGLMLALLLGAWSSQFKNMEGRDAAAQKRRA